MGQETEGIPPLGLSGANMAGFQAALAAKNLLASQRLAGAAQAETPAIAAPGATEFVPTLPVTTGAPIEIREEPQPTAPPPPVACPPPAPPRPAPCITLAQATVSFTNPCLVSSRTLEIFNRPLGELKDANPALIGPAEELCPQDVRRLVLLFGYWPPTDIGIPARRGMLWKWQDLQRNYKDKGFDVLAISPTFPKHIGWSDLARTIKFWGMGEGTLRVDYQATSTDFWELVKKHNPVAILSFSRGAPDKSWEFEAFAKNRPQAGWTISLGYLDDQGRAAPGSPMTWSPPAAGGRPGDKSPFVFAGEKLGRPPDPTEDANFIRNSNLPMKELKTLLEGKFDPANLAARIDDDLAGRLGGEFVSEYMSYHVNWYRDYTQKEFAGDPDQQCWYAGHTHVGVFVDRRDAERAVELQLEHVLELMKQEQTLGKRRKQK